MTTKAYKFLFLFCLLLSSSINLIGQDYIFHTEKNIVSELENGKAEEFTIKFSHPMDTADVLYNWTILENSIPQDWELLFCDANACFDNIPNDGLMLVYIADVEAGFKPYFKLTIANTNNTLGDGLIKIVFWDDALPELTDTVSFDLSLKTLTSNNQLLPEETLYFDGEQIQYSGPTRFDLTVSIYSLGGQLIDGFISNGQTNFNWKLPQSLSQQPFILNLRREDGSSFSQVFKK